MKMFRYSICVLAAMLVAGCEGNDMKDTLGLNREAPDEFTVVSRPPLTVPPEFNLRPPKPGEAPIGLSAEDKAKSLITGIGGRPADTAVGTVSASDVPKGAAASLLKRAGADAADGGIREKLGVDARTPADTSNAKTLMEKLTGKEKKEPTVDAKKESERLRANKDAGKPVNEGEVPEAKPESESLIDKIF